MFKSTHKNIPYDTQKRVGRYPKLYTGELFLETSTKLKISCKSYFEAGYRQLYLIEILKYIDEAIDSLSK